jgi:hypothetical protein
MNVLRTRRKVNSAPSPDVEAHGAPIPFNSLNDLVRNVGNISASWCGPPMPRGHPTLMLDWLGATCGGIVAEFETHHHMFW